MPKSADSDSEPGKHEGSPGIERTKPWHSADDVPSTLLTEGQLADAYEDVAVPALRRDGQDPETDRPSYQWLSNSGFRGLTYALKEYHDTTFATFWGDTLGYDTESSGYDWDIEHDGTRESFQEYLDAKQSAADDWTDSTRETIRYRLARYARSYRERHGTDDLLSPVDDDSDITETEAVDCCRETFAYMSNEYAESPLHASMMQSGRGMGGLLSAVWRLSTPPTVRRTGSRGRARRILTLSPSIPRTFGRCSKLQSPAATGCSLFTFSGSQVLPTTISLICYLDGSTVRRGSYEFNRDLNQSIWRPM
nr:hypothetical protein [Haloarcula sinaiiensis]